MLPIISSQSKVAPASPLKLQVGVASFDGSLGFDVMLGALGAVVSTVKVRAPLCPAFPALSPCTALAV